LLATLVEAARAVLEHGLALIRGESAHGLGSLDGASDRLVDRAFVGERNARHDFARILVGDLEIAIGSVGAVGDPRGIELSEHGSLRSSFAGRAERTFARLVTSPSLPRRSLRSARCMIL